MEEWLTEALEKTKVKAKEDSEAEAKEEVPESPTDKEVEEDEAVEDVEGIKKGREKYYGIQ